ncbi:cysteine hydrolase family protein [Paenibacillus arenilitoris]|uniref:Cysteine hydrolase n=1 Tax=Paenibacillus arenilitoris TaxID=2772299 RepID=A0A927H6A5_9BACL|nr:isochorismatase family cysteine hydrolase [Paenibacillus arenilitoris]MBD2869373.1 cysteine hydrolase [Paenibacillus arenilitoris]
MRLVKEKLTPAKTAVIVVDVQNDFCHPEGACARRGSDVSAVKGMMPHLHGLLRAARSMKVPIIFIQTFHERATDSAAWTSRSDGRSGEVCRTGTWGAEFYEVAPLPDDIIVNKHRYSAFINTRLDSVLRTLNIETLVMTGVSTNVCVESTARHGYMLDYNIAFVADACAAFSEEAHRMTLENIDGFFGSVVRTEQLIETWEALAEETVTSAG